MSRASQRARQGSQHFRETSKATPKAGRERQGDQSDADAEAAAASTLAARLADCRAATADLIEARDAVELSEDWARYLRDAARQIAKVLSDLALDAAFWSDLSAAEQGLGLATPEQRARVMEVLESDLTGLLDLMGYIPPPSSAQTAREMQIALSEAITAPDAASRGELSAEASHRMLVYVFRLRRLIDAVEGADSETPEGKRLRDRLLTMARTGARAIIPATIAAGVGAVLFPVGGVGAAGSAALTASMTVAGKKAAETGVQVASAALIAERLGEQDAKADPFLVLAATERAFFKAALAADAVTELMLQDQPEHVDPLMRASVIEAMRWWFRLERARAAMPQMVRVDPSHMAGRAASRSLVEIRDWIEFADSYDGLQEILDRLQRALEQLSRQLTLGV